jgi:dTDP-4-dehydrorhamnose 3,5-epimerase-like enzyme
MSYNMKKYSRSVDERGNLIAFNELEALLVKRCFIINCKKDAWRGKHYHKKTTQLICLAKGELEVKITDNTGERYHIMCEGSTYLQVPGMQFEFRSISDESTIIVLCDREHDPEDYYIY